MKRLSVVAAVVLVVLMMHPWGGSATDISPMLSCEPDCSGVSNGGKVPNPRNCTEFYYCVDQAPLPHATPCDAPNIFDPVNEECGPGTCEPTCGPGVSGCPLTCNETLSVIADVFNCSVYYYCTPEGAGGPQYCPPERPNFDGTSCVKDESVCCSGYCEPYCDGSGFALVPDPNDCTMFYVCDTEEGVPDEDVHFPCGSGKYFSIQTGRCESGIPNPCRTLCEAAGGGGGVSDSSTTRTSSASSASSSTSSTSSGGGDCASSLTCSSAGFFAACQSCQPEYFDCASAGAAGVLRTCPEDTVFNTNPDYPICVLPSNCPYPS